MDKRLIIGIFILGVLAIGYFVYKPRITNETGQRRQQPARFKIRIQDQPGFFDKVHIFPDGFGFIAFDNKMLQINDRVYGRFKEAAVNFSPDGSRVAVYYDKGKSVGVIVGGKRYGGFNYASDPIYNTDGSQYAFSGQRSTLADLPYNLYVDHLHISLFSVNVLQKRGLEYVYINGKRYGGYAEVSSPQFSPDGSTFAFYYLTRTKMGWQYFLRVGAEVYGPYDEIKYFSLLPRGNPNRIPSHQNSSGEKFSMKEPPFCLVYEQGELEYCRIGVETFGGYSWIDDPVKFSGNRFAFRYRQDNQEYLRLDNTTYGPYAGIGWFGFSPGGEEFIFIFNDERGSFLQTKDRLFGPYEYISDPKISYNERTLAFEFRTSAGKGVNLGGREYLGCELGDHPVFSREGNGWWLPRRISSEERGVLVNGKTYGPYYDIWDFSFNRDGTAFGFIYENQREQYFVRVNDKVLGPYRFPEKLALSEDGRNYSFLYQSDKDNRKQFLQVGDTVFGPNDLIEPPLWLGNSFAAVCYDYDQYRCYIIKDGEIYGPFTDAKLGIHNGKLILLYIKDGYAYVGEWDKHGLRPRE